MKVLERTEYNNGYGCSCCRRDWEETEWIKENDMIPFETLITETVKKLNKNAADGGCVSIIYESDGNILYGIRATIYRVGWYFKALIKDKEYLIEEYKDVSNDEPKDISFLLNEYRGLGDKL